MLDLLSYGIIWLYRAKEGINSMDKRGKTCIRIPASQLAELNKIKSEQGISLNFLIRRGINWVVRQYKEKEIKNNENNGSNPK